MPTRSCFLAGSAAGAIAAMVPRLGRASTADMIFVFVYQEGGIDGFNTVVPLFQYGRYHDRRTNGVGSIAVTESAIAHAGTAFDTDPAVPAGRATQFAFHPQMSGLRLLYGRGKVGLLLGVGIPPGTALGGDPNRLSHETAMIDWSSGSTQLQTQGPSGWVALAMDRTGDAGGFLPQMVAVAGQEPPLFRGGSSVPLVVESPLEDFTYDLIGGTPAAATLKNVDALSSPQFGTEFARGVAADALAYVGRVKTFTTGGPPADYAKIAQPGYVEPASGRAPLSIQLEQIARLIANNAPSRAYWALQLGFDTHSGQDQTHPGLVGDFSNAVYQFYTWLASRHASQRVVLLTYSDFGRRASVNASLGTDHGSANIAFAVGDRVRGGTYGEYPELALGALDDNGNTAVTYDFRNALAPAIGAMGVDPASVLRQAYVKKPMEFLG